MALTKVTGQVINTSTDVTVGVLTVTNTLAVGGTVSIGGTLTYEDVTNIDSVGLITARNGIIVGSGITLSKDGDIFATGVTTATSFVGDGSQLTGVASTENIRTNTNATFLQNINVSGSTTTGSLVSSGAISGTTGTFSSNISLASGKKLSMASDVFKIYHATNANVINESGDFIINNTVSNKDIIFSTGSSPTERLRITSAGLLGIGTDTPVSTLHVTSDANNLFTLQSTDRYSTAYLVDTIGSSFIQNDSGALRFATGGGASAAGGETERLRIDSSGNLGQGTATPTTPDGSNADNSNNGLVFTMYGDSPAINLIHNTSGGSADSTDHAAINFGRIGSSSNPYRAVIGYKQDDDFLRINANNYITFESGGALGSEKMRLDGSGRLLLGTTTEGHVDADNLTVADTGDSGITIRSGTSNSGSIYFSDGTSGSDEYKGAINYNQTDNYLRFYTNGSERVRILSGGGITFNGDTATANALDDYEEGTWTAALSSGETCTSSVTKYTKIGCLVTVNAYITNFSDFNGNTNEFQITGLPFAARSTTSYHGGGSISYARLFNYSYPLLPLVGQSGTYIYFHRQDGTITTWQYQDFHNTGNGTNGNLIVQFTYETDS